jgi:hypothetical protein
MPPSVKPAAIRTISVVLCHSLCCFLWPCTNAAGACARHASSVCAIAGHSRSPRQAAAAAGQACRRATAAVPAAGAHGAVLVSRTGACTCVRWVVDCLIAECMADLQLLCLLQRLTELCFYPGRVCVSHHWYWFVVCHKVSSNLPSRLLLY